MMGLLQENGLVLLGLILIRPSLTPILGTMKSTCFIWTNHQRSDFLMMSLPMEPSISQTFVLPRRISVSQYRSRIKLFESATLPGRHITPLQTQPSMRHMPFGTLLILGSSSFRTISHMMTESACGQKAMEAAMDQLLPDSSKNRMRRSVMEQFLKWNQIHTS
jgi:hypothetical protein